MRRASAAIALLAALGFAVPARAQWHASLRACGAWQPAGPESLAAARSSIDWTARAGGGPLALALRRRALEWRGFARLAPARGWVLAAGDLNLEWAAGGLLASDVDFERSATGAGAARELLRARGTTASRGDSDRGVALAATLGPAVVTAWSAGDRRGAGAGVGPFAIASAPGLVSLAARPSRGSILEAVVRPRPSPRLAALAGRWALPGPAGWGSCAGAFRLRAGEALCPGDAQEGWRAEWRSPAAARLRGSVVIRWLRRPEDRALPTLERRVALSLAGAAGGAGTFTLSLASEESERCQASPEDPARRVILRTQRLLTDLNGRLRATPALSLGLRYRQSGREESLDAAETPAEALAQDEPAAAEWDRGRGGALRLDLDWRPSHGLWAGAALSAAAGEGGASSWVPARGALGVTQWAILPAGRWIAEAWVGTRRGAARLEAACRLRPGDEPADPPRVSVLCGIELRVG
jgi:hypothetical protein